MATLYTQAAATAIGMGLLLAKKEVKFICIGVDFKAGLAADGDVVQDWGAVVG